MADTLYRKRGRRYEPVPDRLDEWSGFMAVCAVRYCLGRSSYAPSVAMDWCRNHWHRLSAKDQHVIVRDVIQWLADRHLWDGDRGMGMQDYRAEWARFAFDRIEANGNDFGRAVVRAALHSEPQQQSPEVAPFLKWIEP